MSEVVDLNTRRDFNHDIESLKRKLNAKHVVIATVNNDGTFNTMIDYDIMDIDLCYAIDCLKVRRRMRNEEIDG